MKTRSYLPALLTILVLGPVILPASDETVTGNLTIEQDLLVHRKVNIGHAAPNVFSEGPAYSIQASSILWNTYIDQYAYGLFVDWNWYVNKGAGFQRIMYLDGNGKLSLGNPLPQDGSAPSLILLDPSSSGPQITIAGAKVLTEGNIGAILTRASGGNGSLAIGENARATEGSTALGRWAQAEGNGSTAVGSSYAGGTGSTAVGNCAATYNYGAVAISGGFDTYAQGVCSIAMGYSTWANNDYSIAIGGDACASEIYSIAIGYSAWTENSHQIVLGAYNQPLDNALFMLGNGTRGYLDGDKYVPDYRSNLFVIMKDGKGVFRHTSFIEPTAESLFPTQGIALQVDGASELKGQVHIAHNATIDGITTLKGKLILSSDGAESAQAIVFNTSAETPSVTIAGKKIVTEGNIETMLGNINRESYEGITIGKGSVVNGENSIALGHWSSVQGASSTALGQSVFIRGENSTGVGSTINIYADYATAMGICTSAEGVASIALGYWCYAGGERSIALGSSSAIGENSIAIGLGAEANNDCSIALGNCVSTSQPYQVALGTYNKPIDDARFMLGNGTDWGNRSNLFVIMKDGRGVFRSTNYVEPPENNPTPTQPVALTVEGSTEVKGNIEIKGKTTLKGDTEVTGTTTFNGKLILSSDGTESAQAIVFNTSAETPSITIAGKKVLTEGSSTGGSGSSSGNTLFGGVVPPDTGHIAIGLNATASNSTSGLAYYSIAIGNSSLASGWGTVSLGDAAAAREPNATALGERAQANGKNSTAVGATAKATGGSSLAMGVSSNAEGNSSLAMGVFAAAKGQNATALGGASSATGD